MSIRAVPFLLLTCALAAGEAARDYPALHTALVADIEEHCPFFEAKGIAEDWAKRKRAWAKAVPKIRDDVAMMDHVVSVLRSLRDGHAGIPERTVQPPGASGSPPGWPSSPPPRNGWW